MLDICTNILFMFVKYTILKLGDSLPIDITNVVEAEEAEEAEETEETQTNDTTSNEKEHV